MKILSLVFLNVQNFFLVISVAWGGELVELTLTSLCNFFTCLEGLIPCTQPHMDLIADFNDQLSIQPEVLCTEST